jgi:uncharacterized protein YqjF (DUF2071 family)
LVTARRLGRSGRGGIYFFSLDATSRAAVPRAAPERPAYRHARGRMTVAGRSISYRLRRTDPRYGEAQLEADYAAADQRPRRPPVA